MDVKFDDFYDLVPKEGDKSYIESIIRKNEIQINKLTPGLQEKLESGSYRHQEMKRILGQFQYPNKLALLDIMGSGKTQSALSWGISRVKSHFSRRILYLVVNDQNKEDIKREFCYDCPYTRTLVQDIRVDVRNRKDNLKAMFKEAKKYITIMKYSEFHNEIHSLLERNDIDYIINQYSGICLILDEAHHIAYPIGKQNDSKHRQIITDIERVIDILDFRISVMVITGTLMNNKPSDLGLIANLIVDKGNKFPDNEIEFNKLTDQDYFDRLYGKILSLSYFPKLQTVFIQGPGGHNYCYPVFDMVMTGIQAITYKRMFEKIANERDDNLDTKQSYIRLQWPSLGVDPEGNTGKAINLNLVRNYLRGKTISEQLDLIRDLDVTKWFILKEALENGKKRFVYIQFKTGSGIPLFETFAQSLGFEKMIPSTRKSKKRRYVVIDGSLDHHTKIVLRNMYNSSDNEDGSICQIIVGTKVMYQSISIRSTYIMDIVNPWWNSAFIDQLKNRISRISGGSTKSTCDIYAYAPRLEGEVEPLPFDYKPSIEDIASKWCYSYFLYQYAYIAKKDVEVQKINRIMKQIALDCSINFALNANPEFIDGSRECNYRECEYKCIVSDPSPNEITYDSINVQTAAFISEIFPQIEKKLIKFGNIGVEDLDPKYPINVRMKIILNLSRMEIMDRFNRPAIVLVSNGRAYITSKMNRLFTSLNYTLPLEVSKISIQDYKDFKEEEESNQILKDIIYNDVSIDNLHLVDRGIRNKILERAIDLFRMGRNNSKIDYVLEQNKMFIYELDGEIYTNFDRTKSSTPITIYRYSPSPGFWYIINKNDDRMNTIKNLIEARLGAIIPYYGKIENGTFYLMKMTGKKTGKYRDCSSTSVFDLINNIILPTGIPPPSNSKLIDDPLIGLQRESELDPEFFYKVVPENYKEIYDLETLSSLYSWYFTTKKDKCNAIMEWMDNNGKLLRD